ncbi:hypothetical protein D9M69_538440 [compost metagenome]
MLCIFPRSVSRVARSSANRGKLSTNKLTAFSLLPNAVISLSNSTMRLDSIERSSVCSNSENEESIAGKLLPTALSSLMVLLTFSTLKSSDGSSSASSKLEITSPISFNSRLHDLIEENKLARYFSSAPPKSNMNRS